MTSTARARLHQKCRHTHTMHTHTHNSARAHAHTTHTHHHKHKHTNVNTHVRTTEIERESRMHTRTGPHGHRHPHGRRSALSGERAYRTGPLSSHYHSLTHDSLTHDSLATLSHMTLSRAAGAVHRAVSGLRAVGGGIMPFVSLGAPDVTASLSEPARRPPPPGEWSTRGPVPSARGEPVAAGPGPGFGSAATPG